MAFVNNVVNGMLLEEYENMEQINGLRIRHRELRDESNPFEMPQNNFIKLFRLSKETARFLINALDPYLRIPQRNTSIPNFIKVLTALNFFGHGSYQLSVGSNHIFGLSQPSVSRCIDYIVQVINDHLAREWIKFPSTEGEKNKIKQRFMEKFNFPGVIGAIDCTHVALIAPPGDDEEYPGRVYFNRKGYTSVNTQIICDADLYILNINARFPGSTHDSGIWMLSSVKRHLEDNYVNNNATAHLLGDSGYPIEPWLLTPVANALENTPEYNYNVAHIRTRKCIEILNGVLKSRFRCMHRYRTLNYHPVKAAKIINTCAVLHNIARTFNDLDIPDDYDQEDDNDDILDIPLNNNWFNEGRRIRNNFIQNYFNY